ncbi:MAG TPA: cytochrome c biogenesis protein CcdA [Chitinophagaceae bacterium]|nr:cytochrome c biogenesis protein CcdA [Chitinophagaceae bacterium]
MKHFIIALGCCLFFTALIAQENSSKDGAVQWNFNARKTAADQYTLIFSADIKEGWKLFSSTMKDDEPNTRIKPDSATLAFIRILNTKETGNLITAREALLGDLTIHYFTKQAAIEMTVQVSNPSKDIKGVLTYMAIKGDSVVGPEEVPFRFSFDAAGNLQGKLGGLAASTAGAQSLKRTAIDVTKPVTPCGGTGGEDSSKKSLWGIFILGFLGGLVGLIMPCTFPMIPLTVSFFTKKSGNKKKGISNAFLYGFFIFLIYVLLSLPFYFLDAGSSDILNNISTNAWLNIGFAVVFIAFALSFFGLYEIGLPGNLSNSVDAKSNIGSISGIFFMALTLAIVSFSCTGPILGSLLVGALNQNGGAFQLTVAMAGFGLALGLPFALFALFPNWLSSLPKSGGWMNTVKIVFGFLELALALKFLSNADLVKHWGLLKREVFFGLWIITGTALVLYLLGILKFAYDPPPKKIGTGRKLVAFFFLLITLYLLPGVTNTKYANRSLVSGFPPPLTYSIYGHGAARGKGVEANIVNDYEKALQLAKEQHKPLLIDFTGWACVNCRKMEENVWPNEQVKALIEKDFILVSLYVDDRKALPDDQQFLFTSNDGSKKAIKTVGDKFITLQSENFKNASQPLYAIVSPDEQVLTLPVGYTPDAAAYTSWLQCGVDAFKKK